MLKDFNIKNNILINYNGQATDIAIQDGITEIREDCFWGSDVISVSVPDSVVEMGAAAFAFCKSLKKIELSNNIKFINYSTFRGCRNLESVKIPEQAAKIGAMAFLKCDKLNYVLLPDGLKSIGPRAFGYCKSLREIAIPESVEVIGDGAFEGCVNLSSIKLPKHMDSEYEYNRIMGGIVINSGEEKEENNSAEQDKFKEIANALSKKMEEEQHIANASKDTFADLYEVNAEEFIYQSVYEYSISDNLLKAFEAWDVLSIKHLLLMSPQDIIQEEERYEIKLEEVFSVLEVAKARCCCTKSENYETIDIECTYDSEHKVKHLSHQQTEGSDIQEEKCVKNALVELQKKYKQNKANTVTQVLKENPELNQNELYRYARIHGGGSAKDLLVEYGILTCEKRNELSNAEVEELGNKTIKQLKEKYGNRPAKLVKDIFEDNPDINQGYLYRYAKTIRNCKVRKLLEEEGIVCPEEKQGMSDDELREYGEGIIKYLKEKYPYGTEKLASHICEEESEINQSYLYKYSKKFFNCGVRELLEKNGIIVLEKSDCDTSKAAEKENNKRNNVLEIYKPRKLSVEQGSYEYTKFEDRVRCKLERLQKKYKSDKADTINQLLRDNPELDQNELYRYARIHSGGSAKDLLVELGILERCNKKELISSDLKKYGDETIQKLKRQYKNDPAKFAKDIFEENPDISQGHLYRYAKEIRKCKLRELLEEEGIVCPEEKQGISDNDLRKYGDEIIKCLQEKYPTGANKTLMQIFAENPEVKQNYLYKYAGKFFNCGVWELLEKNKIIVSEAGKKLSEEAITKEERKYPRSVNELDDCARNGAELILKLKKLYAVKKAKSIAEVYDDNPDISRVCIYNYARKILMTDVKTLFEEEGIISSSNNELPYKTILESKKTNVKSETAQDISSEDNRKILFEEANQIDDTVSFFELHFSREVRWHLYAIKVKKIQQLATVTRQHFYYAKSDAAGIEQEIHEKLSQYIKTHRVEQPHMQGKHVGEPIQPTKKTKENVEIPKRKEVESERHSKKKIKIKITADSVMKEIKTRGKNKI